RQALSLARFGALRFARGASCVLPPLRLLLRQRSASVPRAARAAGPDSDRPSRTRGARPRVPRDARDAQPHRVLFHQHSLLAALPLRAIPRDRSVDLRRRGSVLLLVL